MNRLFSKPGVKQHSMNAAEESKALQETEQALLHLLNDNVAEADRLLNNGDSSFHCLGRGVAKFIAAMFASEKELLKSTAVILAEAEQRTWDDMKRAESDPGAFRSEIYPPGTEYLLAYCLSLLSGAACGVLTGSITEAMRGFYKFRKAYNMLDSIIQNESKVLKARLAKARPAAVSRTTSAFSVSSHLKPGLPLRQLSSMSLLPFDNRPGVSRQPSAMSVANSEKELTESETNDALNPVITASSNHRLLDVDPAEVGLTTHTDIFIHSGVRLCYGMLLIIFSMIDSPMFNKILYIIGFAGDRERGTRYLWQSSRFDSFNSAMSGIALLAMYNGLVGFCDILPTDAQAEVDLAGYPKERCENLLNNMLRKYPDSKLWKMEEARMYAFKKNLEASCAILVDNWQSGMKQIAVINVFELSLTSQFYHDYELCARSWKQCSEMSNWSPCLYVYNTGITYVELYRRTRLTDPTKAKDYKKQATEYIRKAPPLAGKQRVMGKKLPFDSFVERKVAKWEARAKAWNVDLVDATGFSPFVESIFLWNGVKKQGKVELEKDTNSLDWKWTSHAEKFEKDLDEKAAWAVVSASVKRNMGDVEGAKALLEEHVFKHDKITFQGKDDWVYPIGQHELAAIAWVQKDQLGFDHKAKVLECEQLLEKTKNYGQDYLLDARVSIKIQTGLITVRRHKKIMGW